MNKIPPLNLRLDTEGDSCIIIRLSYQSPNSDIHQAHGTPEQVSPDPVNAQLNRCAIDLAHSIQSAIGQALPQAIIEAIPSFDAVGVYYDLDRFHAEYRPDPSAEAAENLSPFALLSKTLEKFSLNRLTDLDAASEATKGYGASTETQESSSRIVEIPVCYELEYGVDLPYLSQELGLSVAQIIELHTHEPMHVFMLGFSPGLPFHGLFDPALNLPRRAQPRTQLVSGSIGIANRQGVIYPFATPGGWHIVGRTPLRLFNANKPPYTLYQAGDKIQFKAISKAEFLTLQADNGTGNL